MTTVINNPGDNNGDASSAGAGVVVGAVLVVLVLVVVVVLALPYIRQNLDAMSHPQNPTINVTLPSMPALNPSSTP